MSAPFEDESDKVLDVKPITSVEVLSACDCEEAVEIVVVPWFELFEVGERLLESAADESEADVTEESVDELELAEER